VFRTIKTNLAGSGYLSEAGPDESPTGLTGGNIKNKQENDRSEQ
jgi:hypothetical protein